MKTILNQLFEGQTLSSISAKDILINISNQKYNNSEVAAFMSVYLMRTLTTDELKGFREALLEMCLKVKFGNNERIDIVGTGGDNKNTFNISTLSCFVVAGAGIKVSKHGNYGVSSTSGSSNLLESIGYEFTNNEDKLNRQLEKAGLCFMHAPLFHPALKNISTIRKELGVRTFFNLLGPLVNPSNPNYQLIGVCNPETLRLYNYFLQKEDKDYTLVHSFDGYDEISTTGKFKCITKQTEKIIEPKDLNMTIANENELYGGNSVQEAKKIFINILNGKGSLAQNNVVIANSAFAITTVKKNITIQDAIEMAKESLKSKKALNVFKKIIN